MEFHISNRLNQKLIHEKETLLGRWFPFTLVRQCKNSHLQKKVNAHEAQTEVLVIPLLFSDHIPMFYQYFHVVNAMQQTQQ